MTWWQRLLNFFRRQPRQPQLVLETSPEILSIYNHIAEQRGLSVHEWARRTLNSAVPRKELERLGHAALRTAGLESAYHQLDLDEEQDLGLTLGSPRSGRRLNLIGKTHPCLHLRPGHPTGYLPRDCQGMCAKQEGRACHWAAAVAPDCAVFEARRPE